MFRDGGELAKAALTFNGVPLLRRHIKTYIPHPLDVVGTTGTNAKFEHPYLRNSLAVWTAEAIAGIESGDRAELSAAYEFDADMRPGTTRQGAAYDGVMRNIRAAHVCLVPRSRPGRDMVVGDGARGMRRSSFAGRFPEVYRIAVS